MHLIIAENSLQNYNGHFWAYTHSLWSYAKEQKWNVSIWAHCDVIPEIRDKLDAIPTFHNRFWFDPTLPNCLWREIRRRWKFNIGSHRFLKDLKMAWKNLPHQDEVIFIFPTAVHRDIKGIISWLSGLAPSKRPQVACILHFAIIDEYGNPNPTVTYYRKVFELIKASKLERNLRLFTDSNILQPEYENIAGIQVEILPIPHAFDYDVTDISPQRKKSIDIIYIGNARSEKGFNLLPDTINCFFKTWHKKNIKFHIQTGAQSDKTGKDIVESIDRLRGIDNVILYENTFTDIEYRSFFNRADIVLLPYIGSQYRSGTSGICCEAIALGKPVVVPNNTWLEVEMKNHGVGSSFANSSSVEFSRAINKVALDIQNMKTKALEAVDQYKKFHSAENYFNILLSSIDRKQ